MIAPHLPLAVAPAVAAALPDARPRLGKQPPRGLRLGLLCFGVLLPIATLIFELVTHECGLVFFDPIPTWWHVFLIVLVPMANAVVFLSSLRGRCTEPGAAGYLQGVALGVSLIYALLIGPLTPVAMFGVLWMGVGLLPLTPLCAFIATWRGSLLLREFLPPGGIRAPLWRGFFIGVLALGIPAGWDAWTDHRLHVAVHGPAPQQQRAIEQLRTAGHWATLLERCYRQPRWGGALFLEETRQRGLLVPTEDAARIFFRVTGTAFNARPAPLSVSGTGRRIFNFGNQDAALGGERVSGKVAGLTLEKSRLESKVQPAALTTYSEWTFEFKNVASQPNEARAQLQLPPGGVVSRLTLWINGEPREAAFGGRAQVRAAYQEVAVVQRRDPVLVTTSGPDRVLMQCFPVPANGGTMKVRVGITAPLHPDGPEESVFVLPRILETNYDPGAARAHQLSITDASAPGTKPHVERLDNRALNRHAPLRFRRTPGSREVWTEDPENAAFAIRQIVRELPAASPRQIAVVLDGSRAMSPHWSALADVLAKAANAPGDRITLHFAGDTAQTWTRQGSARAWLHSRRVEGGRDNLPSLLEAWKAVDAAPDSVILWIHGPQPVEISDMGALRQVVEERVARGPGFPRIFDLAVAPGPNRVADALADFRGWRRADFDPSPTAATSQLLKIWLGQAPEFGLERERVPRDTVATNSLVHADRHVARLWGLAEIDRLRAASATLDDAIKLALEFQLVTPVSGAVVLEEQAQYDRHGLKPVSPASAPNIPEPSAVLLLTAGASFLSMRRRRNASRSPPVA